MFCGECGSSTTATPLSRKRSEPAGGDTSIIQPLPPQSAVFSIPYRMPSDAAQERPIARMPRHGSTPVEPALAESGAVEPVAADPVAADPVAADPVAAEPLAAEPVAADPVAAEPDATEPNAVQAVGAEASAVEPVAQFVLQFSTGEHVVVAGTGLLGRRPNPLPDETFDHFVQIHDVSMSVSKSHLEFGQHNGEFWINDRMSGNGTVIRRHDDSVLRCEPGRRYLVARGSRVEIGDQFFIVG
jgi:hypothetical protein